MAARNFSHTLQTPQTPFPVFHTFVKKVCWKTRWPHYETADLLRISTVFKIFVSSLKAKVDIKLPLNELRQSVLLYTRNLFTWHYFYTSMRKRYLYTASCGYKSMLYCQGLVIGRKQLSKTLLQPQKVDLK